MSDKPKVPYDPVVIPITEIGSGARGVPEPIDTIEAVLGTAAALKEAVETLLGLRGDEGSIQKYVADALAAHKNAPNPHEYLVTKEAALAVFAYAAYESMHYSGAALAWPDITGTFQTIDIVNAKGITGRGITGNTTSGGMAFDTPGVYYVTVAGSINHNSSNSGRITNLRFYNLTDGAVVGSAYQIGVGRNVEVTQFSLAVPVQITIGAGKELGVQIGGGDTLTTVEWTSFMYSAHSIGEYQGELPGTDTAR